MRTLFHRASLWLLLCVVGCSGKNTEDDAGTDGTMADAPVGCGADDCSALDDACHFGVCDPVAAQCVAAPRASGTACDDGNVCTAGDACAAGTCVGTPMDGVSCVDGEACASDATCMAGVCVGTFAAETTCATARTVPLADGTQRIDGTLDCVSTHHTASCGGAGSERLYTLDLASPRRVRISAGAVPGGATDLVLSLRETCDAPASELACSASELEATLSAGTHTLVVDSAAGSGGGAFAIDIDVLEPDTCAQEPEVVIPRNAGGITHVRGDTTGEGDRDFPTHFCNPTSSPDHVYRFVLTETSALRFRGEAGTTFDAYLTLLSGTCASPTAIACNDDGPSSNLPELVSTLPPGEYHLVVTGVYSMNWGKYDISITRL